MCVTKLQTIIIDLQMPHGGKARSHPGQEYLLVT